MFKLPSPLCNRAYLTSTVAREKNLLLRKGDRENQAFLSEEGMKPKIKSGGPGG